MRRPKGRRFFFASDLPITRYPYIRGVYFRKGERRGAGSPEAMDCAPTCPPICLSEFNTLGTEETLEKAEEGVPLLQVDDVSGVIDDFETGDRQDVRDLALDRR